jgi:hypothetical protein
MLEKYNVNVEIVKDSENKDIGYCRSEKVLGSVLF